MLAATVVIWALNFTVTRYVLNHGFHPLAYSVVRYGLAATLSPRSRTAASAPSGCAGATSRCS